MPLKTQEVLNVLPTISDEEFPRTLIRVQHCPSLGIQKQYLASLIQQPPVSCCLFQSNTRNSDFK